MSKRVSNITKKSSGSSASNGLKKRLSRSICNSLPLSSFHHQFLERVLHTPLLIECKRIQKAARFKDRFDEAEDQLVRNLANEASPGSKGVIAIDISKTQNPGASVFKAESAADVRAMLIGRANQFCWQRIKLFQEQIEEAILAAIVYLRIPWITGSDIMAALNSQFIQLIPLNQNVDRNKRIFETLVT